MADRELRKLSRKQLLELLLQLTERSEELQDQLQEANKKLENKRLIKMKAGSIAEASLKLSGVFEAADNAAEQYLYNLKKLDEEKTLIKKRYDEKCKKIVKAMILETYKRCQAREEESRNAAHAMIAEAEERCRAIDAETEKKIREAQTLYKYVLNEKKKLK